jgi:hypothetical protein
MREVKRSVYLFPILSFRRDVEYQAGKGVVADLLVPPMIAREFPGRMASSRGDVEYHVVSALQRAVAPEVST